MYDDIHSSKRMILSEEKEEEKSLLLCSNPCKCVCLILCKKPPIVVADKVCPLLYNTVLSVESECNVLPATSNDFAMSKESTERTQRRIEVRPPQINFCYVTQNVQTPNAQRFVS